MSAQFITNVYWVDEKMMPNNETIYYHPNSKLKWSDFNGEPNLTGNVAAITASGFGYKATMKNNGTKGQLNIAVYCYFNKNKSWVKPDKKTGYILNHEQHHFDVSFIAANLFFERLKKAGINFNNYNKVLPDIYKECCDLMNKMQDEYDGQTKNGQLKDVQEKWNRFIISKLAK
ncbi:MAG: hypothetical protein JSU03_09320 [Bacteroidetes bacterium]|nr:hypothetical protein [Bacteroidota bacterium]MBS1757465.1 hypothetical protein [Bacteroidota bacterium]